MGLGNDWEVTRGGVVCGETSSGDVAVRFFLINERNAVKVSKKRARYCKIVHLVPINVTINYILM